MKNWVNSLGENNDIVISSRIRMARNLKTVLFPNKLNVDIARENINNIEKAFFNNEKFREQFNSYRLWENEPGIINTYLEKHLISSALIKNYKSTAFIIDQDETTSIMINEEDHIRLQCINKGFNLRETYKEADKLDSMLEEYLDYAFDENLGYLTACPTNLGTGMRASVMIHLPAITMSEEITPLLKGLTQVGMTIRGLYGEGSRADGNMYQISNQISLGVTEEEILSNLEAVVAEIILQENKAREILLSKYKYEMEDKIFRALGVLKSSILLSTREALELLSYVRMGVEMGIINNVDNNILNKLLVNIQPSTLEIIVDKKLNEKEKNIERAKYVREVLNKKEEV